MDRFRSQSDPSDNISVSERKRGRERQREREAERERERADSPGQMMSSEGKNKRNLPLIRARESLIAIRDGRAERVREISAGESAELFARARVRAQFHVHSESASATESASFRSVAPTDRQTERRIKIERERDIHIIGTAGNYAARKRPLITPHSWITAVDGPRRDASRRVAPSRSGAISWRSCEDND